jgi:nicotinate dehydrogenase subunit A
MVIAAAAPLAANPAPTEQEVRAALDGNLCRCGTHGRVVAAVLRAARHDDGPEDGGDTVHRGSGQAVR